MKNDTPNLFYFLIVMFVASCTTTYKSGFETNKNKIAINLKEHNLGYMFPPDTLAALFKSENLDKFDYSFISNVYNGLNQAGFSSLDTSNLETVKIKNCVIDFKLVPQFPKTFVGDTLYINYLQANLICQSTNTQSGLFYAFAQVPENYDAVVLAQPYQFPQSYHTKTRNWIINKNSAYDHLGFNQDLLLQLSTKLSNNMVAALDTLARNDFTLNQPVLAAQTETIRQTGPLFTLFWLGLFVAVLFIR